MESEQGLLNDIKEGDRNAMHRLYECLKGYATTVSLRYISDRDAVNDVLQDSFIKIFSRIDEFEFRGEGSLKGWAMRIVANESMNYLRRNGRLIFVDEVPEIEDEGEVHLERVPMDVMLHMIQQLPEGYRAVFNMYVFGQMSHKQIALELGIKENSSASQYSRAKNMLARMIKEYMKNHDG